MQVLKLTTNIEYDAVWRRERQQGNFYLRQTSQSQQIEVVLDLIDPACFYILTLKPK